MKKFIRFMLVVIGIFVVAVLVLAIVEPKDVTVTRSVLIKAPKDSVFAQMVYFKNWHNWSPWTRMDTAMKMSYYGADGQQGSGYKWDGSKNTGAGEMKNTSVDGTRMNIDIMYTEPYDGRATSVLKATDSAGMTRATWSITMHQDFPMNASHAFVDMDKLLGGDFADGLANMKAYLEGRQPAAPETPAAAGVEVKEVDYPAHTYAGVRQVVSWTALEQFTLNNFAMVGRVAAAKVTGPACGLYFSWDTVKYTADVLAGYAMKDTLQPVKGVAYLYVPGGKAYMAVQHGGNSQAMAYHNAIEHHMAAKGKTQRLVIEEYVTGAKETPDTTKWVTNIYYLEK